MESCQNRLYVSSKVRGGFGSQNYSADNLASAGAMQPLNTAGMCRTLYLVNREPELRERLRWELARNKYRIVTFPSAESLLATIGIYDRGVLILDVEAKGMPWQELQPELRKRNTGLKVIVLSEVSSIQLAVHAIKCGAVDFIGKPVSYQQILNSIEIAFQLANAELEKCLLRECIEKRCQRLTPPEREVMNFIVCGFTNRRLAKRLGVSERTVEIHRARVMAKMDADSVPDLVRMVYLYSNCQSQHTIVDDNLLGVMRRNGSHRSCCDIDRKPVPMGPGLGPSFKVEKTSNLKSSDCR